MRKKQRYILPRAFYELDTVNLAKKLLGKELCVLNPEGECSGFIVETEAYLFKGDPACHAHRGMTPRNKPMFGAAGASYIYFIYGMYECFNVVSGKVGEGEAVLIRALKPRLGIAQMQKRRAKQKLKDLCSGPGKLCMAMGLNRDRNDIKLNRSPFCIRSGLEIPDSDIHTTTRIGIKEGAELPLRFYIKESEFISKK